MAQNVISKTATILYSIRKRISKIYQLKNYGSLKSLKSIKIQSYSFVFIHSVMSENDKSVPFIIFDFHMKRGKRTHLVFSKRRFQGFVSEILRVVGLLGEKYFFSTPLGHQKFLGISDSLFILMLSF